MFGFISFGLKIILSSIIGGAINYIPGDSDNTRNIIKTCLICVFSASVLGLTRQFSYNGEYLTMGFGILAVVIVVNSISKNLDFEEKIILLFAAVIGMIIGSGFLIQACLLGGMIYLIQDKVNGILVPKSDYKEMALTIKLIIEGEIDGQLLSDNARKKVEKYDQNIVIDQWVNFLNIIINE